MHCLESQRVSREDGRSVGDIYLFIYYSEASHNILVQKAKSFHVHPRITFINPR